MLFSLDEFGNWQDGIKTKVTRSDDRHLVNRLDGTFLLGSLYNLLVKSWMGMGLGHVKS